MIDEHPFLNIIKINNTVMKKEMKQSRKITLLTKENSEL